MPRGCWNTPISRCEGVYLPTWIPRQACMALTIPSVIMTRCLTGPHRSHIHSPMTYIGRKKSRRSGNLPPRYQMVDPISPDDRYHKTNASFVVLLLNRTPHAPHRCLSRFTVSTTEPEKHLGVGRLAPRRFWSTQFVVCACLYGSVCSGSRSACLLPKDA
jgi:hypothetical protein